jgi:alpha-D-ribose 1-methylphosphonate 5-triphosphate synthase subunit PhnH
MPQALNPAMAPGFTDAASQTQSVFRAVMNALAHPTRLEPLTVDLTPPEPLTPQLAAIALAMADVDAPIWLDARLTTNPAVAGFLRFHTGAPIVQDPKLAAFALVADATTLIPFEQFAIGSEEYPDRSTTLVIAVNGFDGADAVAVEGPGMASGGRLSATPLPTDFRAQWRNNQGHFPRGVDLIFAAPGVVCALPRSSRLSLGT